MQPVQYYLQGPAAKDNSITHAAAARSNLDAVTTMRSAEIELQNTIEYTQWRQNYAQSEKKRFWRFKRKLQLQNRMTQPDQFIYKVSAQSEKQMTIEALAI